MPRRVDEILAALPRASPDVREHLLADQLREMERALWALRIDGAYQRRVIELMDERERERETRVLSL